MRNRSEYHAQNEIVIGLRARQTAQHMLSMHRDSSYTPRERATDHALSYPISAPQYAFWLAVVDAIDAVQR